MTGSAPGHCIDVVIVTAIKDEYDEALEVDTGAIEAEWDVRPGPTGLGVAFRSYRARDGGVLRIALTRALEMRGVATAAAVTPLLTEYKPRCVAMCGVCAGRRGDVDLGDVIIADKLWTYDVGSLKAGRFKPETTTYLLAATWKHPAENFVISPDAEWLADRPVPLELQTRWVLEMLERGEDPLRHAERLVRCADWSAALERLWQHKLLLEDRVELSAKGRKLIKREMLKHPDGLPPQPDFRTHVGPIATGNNVVRDPKIFDKLAGTDRKVLGVEMEAAAVGAIAHLHDIDQIVMKAAMDFGDLDKNDNFKQFAARAAAECLIAFLRANMASDKAGQGVLTPGTFERPSQMSPAASLNAKYELVPFFPDARRAELTALEQWLDDDKQPVAIRLFYGPGGAGKTRLMIETCKARRDLGWSAGFLAPEVTDDEFDTVLAEAKDTLVVLDYAEARPGLRERLDRVVKMLGRRAHRLRVVLLARTISDWWRRLLEHSDGLRNMVQTDAPIELAMVEATGPMRTRMFDAAFGAFRANTGEPGGSPPRTDLGEARYARPLYIHMAALAAAEGVVIQAGELLEYVLDHEQRFWTGHFRASAVLDEDAFKRAARWSVAAVTLRGGAPTREEAEGITEKVGGPRQSQFVDFLRRLYPGSDRPEATDCYVSALEPDLIGETVVLRVLKDMDTPRDYLDRVFDGAPRAAMRQGFIVLGRVALGHPEEMQPWLEAALHADILTRARAAMDAAMAFTTQTAFAPLGLLVAERLQQVRSVKGTEQLELARSLESEIPDQTVSLREVAAWVFATLIAHLPAGSDEKILSERARLLNNLGIRLGALGRREEALEATKEAVEHYRELSNARPDAFLPDLAMSLNNLGNRLSELGRREEALEATKEAVEIRRELSKARPDAFLPDLAMSLNNLGLRLGALGRREEALEATKEAVEHYRELSRARPDAFLPYLAASLNNLGPDLSELGRREEALEATKEAVEHYRALSKARPDAFLPYLAASLNNLGLWLGALGRREEALEATKEAVEIRRELSKARPDAFLPYLAASLNNLGIRLSALGRREEALEATKEAVEHYTQLVEALPAAFMQNFLISVRSLTRRLAELEHAPELDPTLVAAAELIERLGVETGPPVDEE